jgi:3-methylfumaryl-CoA hydratase
MRVAEPFAEWIGRSIETTDLVVEAPVRRLAATLDHDGAHWPKGLLPPLGHWLFHLPDAAQSVLGGDGHPVMGGFLPPIAQPRRMWAGGRLRFLAPIPFGATLAKRTTIVDIVEKQGASGGMTFLTLRHELSVQGVLAVEEEQDLVYLPVTAPAPPKSTEPRIAESERHMTADAALLFRFSALTFNAHRIHYDLPYALAVELYPALVVHGPLQAMLLIDHALREGVAPTRFAFRARAPLYPGRLTLARADKALWVRDDSATVTMTAEIA